MKHKIIIDTDIGTYYDDALAVLYACRAPELELLGVTTVYGDTDLRSKIARKILNVAEFFIDFIRCFKFPNPYRDESGSLFF